MFYLKYNLKVKRKYKNYNKYTRHDKETLRLLDHFQTVALSQSKIHLKQIFNLKAYLGLVSLKLQVRVK